MIYNESNSKDKSKADRFGESYVETKQDRKQKALNSFYTKYKIPILILLTICILAFIFFYFTAFFKQGIRAYDEFFALSESGNVQTYTAPTSYGDAKIVVTRVSDTNSTVLYDMPGNMPLLYDISFIGETEGYKNISIKSDSGLSFEGKYRSDEPYLIDQTGDYFLGFGEENVFISTNNPFEQFSPSIIHTVSLTQYTNTEPRGNIVFLLIALFLFASTAFDIKWPLAMFTLEHFLSVNNPEPSDFYIMMQRLSWVVMPIIGVASMLLGLIL